MLVDGPSPCKLFKVGGIHQSQERCTIVPSNIQKKHKYKIQLGFDPVKVNID